MIPVAQVSSFLVHSQKDPCEMDLADGNSITLMGGNDRVSQQNVMTINRKPRSFPVGIPAINRAYWSSWSIVYTYPYRCVWISIHYYEYPSQPAPELGWTESCPEKEDVIPIISDRKTTKSTKTGVKQLPKSFTSGGRHSVACFLRTENPPWVLVSDAVKTLQKEWTFGFGGSERHGSGLVGSTCYIKMRWNKHIINWTILWKKRRYPLKVENKSVLNSPLSQG